MMDEIMGSLSSFFLLLVHWIWRCIRMSGLTHFFTITQTEPYLLFNCTPMN